MSRAKNLANFQTTITDGTTSVATSFVTNGSAKAWVNFDGQSTATIQDSNNIASLTDQGTGQYQFAFVNNMGNVNFALTSSTGNRDSSNAGVSRNSQMGSGAVGTFHYECSNPANGSNEDPVAGYAVIQGDLA